MKKMKLALDNLAVESFSTDGGGYWTGTVDARSLNTMDQCNTQAADCTMGNPCTSDGYATLDAVLCAGSAGTACGGDQTIAATTCRITGICCGDRSTGCSIERTLVCCQYTGAC